MVHTFLSTNTLGAVLAVIGLLPAGMAMAAERPHQRGQGNDSVVGTVEAVQRERIVLVSPEGRRVEVKAEACAASLRGGERVTFTGHNERRGFEARQMIRDTGEAVPCRGERGERAAAQPAAVSAEQAMAAAGQAGYRAVSRIEWEHGAWHMRAMDAQGQPARLRVDGTTGQVAPAARR